MVYFATNRYGNNKQFYRENILLYRFAIIWVGNYSFYVGT